MARAPRPGTTPNAKQEQARKTGVRITVNGEESEIWPADIGPRDDAMVRRETNRALGYKLSLVGALKQLGDEDGIGMDSICLLWWWGRVKAGVTDESLDAALDRFPTAAELDNDGVLEMAEITEGDDGDPLSSAEP